MQPMKSTTLVLAALSLCGIARAAEQAAWFGEPDCRIANVGSRPQGNAVKWSGRCEDGYAEGEGTLTWKVSGQVVKVDAILARGEISGDAQMSTGGATYIGTFLHGVPHGHGFIEYAGGKGKYEGDLVQGKRDGYGKLVEQDLSSYEGQWKNNLRHGTGKQLFALGGSYEGEWKNDKFDGHGTIVHAGSGRRYEGEFKDGQVVEAAPRAAPEVGHYSLKYPRSDKEQIVAFGPLDATWQQLTPGQQNLVKNWYKALEDGDEPPYPLDGTGRLYATVGTFRNAGFSKWNGDLLVHILVGKDGKPKSVKAFNSPHPEFTRVISMALMGQQFKPAVCHGEPCEMMYPISFSFQPAI
jgi:hypothetical protein